MVVNVKEESWPAVLWRAVFKQWPSLKGVVSFYKTRENGFVKLPDHTLKVHMTNNIKRKRKTTGNGEGLYRGHGFEKSAVIKETLNNP